MFDLDNCPCCGSKVVYRKSIGIPVHRIDCTGCPLKMHGYIETKEELFEKFNKRQMNSINNVCKCKET